jgi:DNA-binding Lrp family transcriptional regulator
LKDIANACGLSSTAIVNRIQRLKAKGVITGSVLFINMSQMGYMYPASIGVDLKPGQIPIISKILPSHYVVGDQTDSLTPDKIKRTLRIRNAAMVLCLVLLLPVFILVSLFLFPF